MDLHSRRIIGWALRETLDASLVTEALDRAFGCRSVNLDELMIHTDQGSQYTGKEFQKRLVDKKIKCSMSGRGNYWDNAVVESFFATLKDEPGILDGLIRDPERDCCPIFGRRSKAITIESDVILPLVILLQLTLRNVICNVLN